MLRSPPPVTFPRRISIQPIVTDVGQPLILAMDTKQQESNVPFSLPLLHSHLSNSEEDIRTSSTMFMSLLMFWCITCTYIFSLLPRALATCYKPNGDIETDDTYQPCSKPNTICCATNRPNPAGGEGGGTSTSDECLPNGVCQNRALRSGQMEILYFRERCTQTDWLHGACLDVCLGDVSIYFSRNSDY